MKTKQRQRTTKQPGTSAFVTDAQRILSLKIADRTSRLGGYGPGGEVIYERHPAGCPSVLVDNQGPATATYMSNGSIGLVVNTPGKPGVPSSTQPPSGWNTALAAPDAIPVLSEKSSV